MLCSYSPHTRSLELTQIDPFGHTGRSGPDRWHSPAGEATIEAGADLIRTRRDFSRRGYRPLDPLHCIITGSSTVDGKSRTQPQWRLATIADVLNHCNEAPDAMIGHNEAKSLSVSSRELRQLEAFLATLAGPVSDLPATIK